MGACLSKPNDTSAGGASKQSKYNSSENMTMNENGGNFNSRNQNRYVNNSVRTGNAENATGTSRSIGDSQPQALSPHDIEVAIKAGLNQKFFLL